MRVVDDFAGEEDVAAGEPRDRLVGVVDRAIDAVAEAELAREVEREAALVVAEAAGADLVDERAVVRRGELARDGLFHVEALAEDQRLRRAHFTTSRACGVISSSALSVLTRGWANASERSSSSFCEVATGVSSLAQVAACGRRQVGGAVVTAAAG